MNGTIDFTNTSFRGTIKIRMRLESKFVLPVVVFLSVISWVTSQKSVVSFSVQEEQDALTKVGNIASRSLLYENVTTEVFDQLSFQILTQGNQDASYFTIDETVSTLLTASKLDREEICPDMSTCLLEFSVAVYIKDRETEVVDLYKIIGVEVILEDINDNPPEFPRKYETIPISENSPVDAEYFLRGATDLDTGVGNSVQTYIMEPQNEMFGLKVLENNDGSTDLNLVVKYPLDRESRHEYHLVIYAVDGGSPIRTGSVNVNISITDQNDNSPVFLDKEYNITVQENTPVNTSILVVTATDADSGDNGLVSYQFSSRTSSKITEVFAINRTTGEITLLSTLDYEESAQKDRTFQIEALDNASPPKSAKVKVTVNIADINDNYPQININLPPGGTAISEAAERGSFVAHVAVFDLDAGVNGEIRCKIQGNDFQLEDFKIENNYKVVLNKQLDHEEMEMYEVKIDCEDGGSPPKSNTTSFTVIVEDINDNPPVFSKQIYELTIQEETHTSTTIQVTATDADSGNNGKITYGLLGANPEKFYINTRSGLIITHDAFDREQTPNIIFKVLAWDAGAEPETATATVQINITDINDNAPVFPSHPVHLEIMENDASSFAVLSVTDPDFGPNGQFTLHFPQNDYLDKYFKFHPDTGKISALQGIDREKTPYFSFWVTAVDKGIPQMSSSAEVILTIKDDNDNIPAITYPHNFNKTCRITIAAPVGLLITMIEATDSDEGKNAQLLYFIDSGDPRGLFKMNVSTGRISVARKMEEKDADEYNLEIAVRDNGDIQRTSWANLKIIVEPTNATILGRPEEEGQTNVMIVVIFVIITVVLSIAIIAIIFVIRHIDRRNRASAVPKIDENRYYDAAPRADESMSASSNMSKDSDTELLKKRAKKEVSFSINGDGDTINNSSLTNVTSFSTVKTMPSYMTMDYKPEDSQNSTWLGSNTTSTESKFGSYGEKEISSLTDSQLHHAIHQLQQDPAHQLWLQPVKEEEARKLMTALKKADDNHSQTSAETGTSDSGRGGSEEDINSNRGHTLSDSEENRSFYTDNRQRSGNKAMPRRLPPPIPTDNSYQRNISFSDDSVNANTTVASYKKAALKSPSLSEFKTPMKTRDLFFISGRSQGDTFLNSQMTTPGMPYSVGDIDDVSEMATCRDDASTTTSGSYTINPEDLCNEIDELFFKDVIV